MDDKRLTFVSLALAAIGIVTLLGVTSFLKPEPISLTAIGPDDVGKVVMVEADISSISEKNGNLFLGLADGGVEMRAVYWESEARGDNAAYSLKAGERAAVTGQVATYRSELELVVKKISKAE